MTRLEYEKAVTPVRAKYGVTDPRPHDKRPYPPAQEAYVRETAGARVAFFDVVAPAKAALKRSLADPNIGAQHSVLSPNSLGV